MFGEHHSDLAAEFPELKDKIHHLKSSSTHFSKLVSEYETVAKEVYRIEEQIETPSDAYTENKKKQRVALKDQIYAMLMKA